MATDRVRPLALEPLCAVGVAKERKERKEGRKEGRKGKGRKGKKRKKKRKESIVQNT